MHFKRFSGTKLYRKINRRDREKERGKRKGKKGKKTINGNVCKRESNWKRERVLVH